MKRKAKNFITTISTTVITVLVLFFVLYNVPLSWLDVVSFGGERFGAVTNIAETDTLANSRTTINDNFTALDTGKIDNASSTMESLTSAPNLTTIGTITTGTWNADVLTVTYGGTGAPSFTNNTLFYGNGTGAFTEVATGTASQLLTLVSGQPAWTSPSVDETPTLTPKYSAVA